MAKVVVVAAAVAVGIGAFLASKKKDEDAGGSTRSFTGTGSKVGGTKPVGVKQKAGAVKKMPTPQKLEVSASPVTEHPHLHTKEEDEIESRREAAAQAAEHRLEQQILEEAKLKGEDAAIMQLVTKVSTLEKKGAGLLAHSGKLNKSEESLKETLVTETKAVMGALEELIADDDEVRSKRRSCLKAAKTLLSSLEIAGMTTNWSVSNSPVGLKGF